MGGFSSNAFGFGDGSMTTQSSPDLTTQGFTETSPGTPPGFQTTWQQAGYDSLEAMKDATDPGWRNSPAQIGMTGGIGQPMLSTMNTAAPGPMTGGNLVDYNGNPIGGGFGTQMTMATPRPQVGFGGGKGLVNTAMQAMQTQPVINPAQRQAIANQTQQFANTISRPPRINQGIIPVAQNARRVNVPAPNPFTRLRRR